MSLFENRIISSQIKIGYILKCFLEDPEFFKYHSIVELCDYFNINKRTLKKYLKNRYKKRKTGNIKNIYITSSIEVNFLQDLENLRKKYQGHIDNSTVRLGQYYLNNLRL